MPANKVATNESLGDDEERAPNRPIRRISVRKTYYRMMKNWPSIL